MTESPSDGDLTSTLPLLSNFHYRYAGGERGGEGVPTHTCRERYAITDVCPGTHSLHLVKMDLPR